MGIKEWLIPTDQVFVELLEKESSNVLTSANALFEMIMDFTELPRRRTEIKNMEKDGDEIVHTIYLRLNQTFVTPLDREDIAFLSSTLDDVVDLIYAVANRIYLYEISKSNDVLREFATIIVKSVEQIQLSLSSINRLDPREIESRCIEVDRLENEADNLLNQSVADLFKDKDVVTIIKFKEIYEQLEMITDSCEDVSDIVRRLALQNS
ncbi:MAG: DUF47 family protein [Thaumarchaeota archaeon]|nr:DUF47 family protein [Nitrososphaerota archaeon]